MRLPPSLRERLHLLPTVSPADLPSRLAEFDLGLALEPTTPPSRDRTITNKFFQYLNAGLGLIATSTAGQREVFAQVPDIGVIVNFSSPDQAAARLDDLLNNPAAIRTAQRAARRAAETRFSWEHESVTLLQAVALALDRKASS
jgi:glycosyltransferase involved in cell wall biosynthesis